MGSEMCIRDRQKIADEYIKMTKDPKTLVILRASHPLFKNADPFQMLLDEIGPFEGNEYSDSFEEIIEYSFEQNENKSKTITRWEGSIDIDTQTGLVNRIFAKRNESEIVLWNRDRGFLYGDMQYKEYVFVVLIKLHQKFPKEIKAESYAEIFRKLRRTTLLNKYPPIAIASNRSPASAVVDEGRAITLRMREASKKRQAFLNEGMLGHDAAVAKFLTNKNKRTRRNTRKT